MKKKIAQRRKFRRTEQGSTVLETVLILPLTFAFYIGTVATNTLVQANRHLEWAVGTAFVDGALRNIPSHSVLPSGQNEVAVTYFTKHSDSEFGKYDWENSPANKAISSQLLNCASGSFEELSCAAQRTIEAVGRALHSSQGPTGIKDYDIAVKYEDDPLGLDSSATNPEKLFKYRKLTISVTGHFDDEMVITYRRIIDFFLGRPKSDSPDGWKVLPSWSVSRSELLG